MEILASLITFIDGIMSIKIGIANITILDILIYIILLSSVVKFIKIATKGK